MNQTRNRRFGIGIVVATAALAVGTGNAAAFEPPHDPTDTFTCDGGPVAGHPGRRGLATAMVHAASTTAWSAVDNAAPITLCG